MSRLPFLLTYCLIALLLACGDSDPGSTEDRPGPSCADGTQRCPEGFECQLNAAGAYQCLETTIPILDFGTADADRLDDATPMTPDAMPSSLSCLALCQGAIDCIYSGNLCRALTPGEERDVMGQCTTACMADRSRFANLESDDCATRAEAIFSQVSDLTLLCGSLAFSTRG